MFYVLLLLCIVTFLAKLYDNQAKKTTVTISDYSYSENRYVGGGLFYFVISIILILFSGTRTRVNDTTAYINSYLTKIPDHFNDFSFIDFSIGSNPGFVIYQTFIKSLFGDNFTWFLTFNAIIIVISFLAFLRRYSADFSVAVFVFIASTGYALTMAAQKQVLATAIGIWLFPLAFKRKWFSFFLLLCLAISFHPYVFTYICIPFLICPIWKKRSMLILIAGIIVMTFFASFMSVAMAVTNSIGDDYSMFNYMNVEHGVNILRLAVFAVVPVLSFVYRKKINSRDDLVLATLCNLSLIAMFFMSLAAISDPNSFGRLANYYEIYLWVALATILKEVFAEQTRGFIYLGCYICYTIYYMIFYSKWPVGFFFNMYENLSVFKLLEF